MTKERAIIRLKEYVKCSTCALDNCHDSYNVPQCDIADKEQDDIIETINMAIEALEKERKAEIDDIYARLLQLRKAVDTSQGDNFEFEISANLIERLKDESRTALIPVGPVKTNCTEPYIFGVHIRETTEGDIIRLWKEIKL